MKIDSKIKKCVAFVSLKRADGNYEIGGTCFLIGRDNTETRIAYTVTAKHVIEAIKRKGLEHAYIRVNSQNNSVSYIHTEVDKWIFHDDITVDIAIYPFQFDRENIDQLGFPDVLTP